MSCRFLHWWKRIDKDKVGTYYQVTYGCRRCAASKTEYVRQGQTKKEEKRDADLVSHIGKAALLSLMLWLLALRFVMWVQTQPEVVETDTPMPYHNHSPAPAPAETVPLDYFNPYTGN